MISTIKYYHCLLLSLIHSFNSTFLLLICCYLSVPLFSLRSSLIFLLHSDPPCFYLLDFALFRSDLLFLKALIFHSKIGCMFIFQYFIQILLWDTSNISKENYLSQIGIHKHCNPTSILVILDPIPSNNGFYYYKIGPYWVLFPQYMSQSNRHASKHVFQLPIPQLKINYVHNSPFVEL